MNEEAQAVSMREHVVLESVSDAVIALDAEWRITLLNRAAEQYFNVRRGAVLGRAMIDVFPMTSGSIYEECVAKVMRSGEELTFVAPSVTVPDRTIEMRVAPMDRGVVATFSDVTERKHAEDVLRESEKELRLVTDAVPALIGIVDHDQRYRFVNRAYADAFSRTRDEIVGRHVREVVGEQTYARVRPYIQAALNGIRVCFDNVIPPEEATDGFAHYFDSTYVPRIAADGSVEGFYTLLIDVSERRRAEAAQQMLIAELQHRTRNLLAIVRAVSTRVRQSSRSLDDYGRRFDSRLEALGRVQSLLSEKDGKNITLRDLITIELTAHGAGLSSGRVSMEGPDVRLPSSAVQILALALHELATNAVKYGAIGQKQARLHVRWDVSGSGGKRTVAIRWSEEGVRMQSRQQEEGRGFGRELIERALPYDLGAQTVFGFAADGVRCEIVVPLDGGMQ